MRPARVRRRPLRLPLKRRRQRRDVRPLRRDVTRQSRPDRVRPHRRLLPVWPPRGELFRPLGPWGPWDFGTLRLLVALLTYGPLGTWALSFWTLGFVVFWQFDQGLFCPMAFLSFVLWSYGLLDVKKQ